MNAEIPLLLLLVTFGGLPPKEDPSQNKPTKTKSAQATPAPQKPSLPNAAEEKPAQQKLTEIAVAPVTAEIYDPKSLDVLRGKKGQIITVEGTVAKFGESRSGTFRYLNFTSNYKDSLSLVFPVAKNPEFTAEKLKEWEGRKVRATGTVTEFNGNLQIAVEKWDQLKKVEESAPAAAK